MFWGFAGLKRLLRLRTFLLGTEIMIRSLLYVLPLFLIWTGATEAADVNKIRAKLAHSLESRSVGEVKPTAVNGLYQVMVNGQLLYTTEDAQYIVQGSIYEVDSGKNLTTLSILDTISDKDAVVFAPKKTKHSITVFTDTSCGYCRKSKISII